MSPLATFLWVIGLALALGLAYLVLEAHTLRDATPDNHITASVRLATKKHPGLVVLLWGLLQNIVGMVVGHIWAEW